MPTLESQKPGPEAFANALSDADVRTTSTTTTQRNATYVPPTAPPTRQEVVTREDGPVRGPLGFSFSAGFFGWAVASFFALLLTVLALALFGANMTADGVVSTAELGSLTMAGIVAGVVVLFVAYFLGGFAAGRIGIVNGALHGASILAWTLLFGLLAFAVAAYAADALDLAAYAYPYRIDWNALTATGVVVLVLSLLAMLGGAMLGGMLGAREWIAERFGVTARRTVRRGRTV